MCGLIFSYVGGAERAYLEPLASRALDSIAHRGPDDRRLEFGTGWVMGHCRLAIIDLDDSRQPMSDPSGRYSLAYNGEVYNYRELRADLEAQWRFRTRGDTEVVLAGLVLRGPEFLERMEGMWAIALWDDSARQLLLARDRVGKKPLFFTGDRRGFACASELPSLRLLADRAFDEDVDSTADYFRFGFQLPGSTAYVGIEELLPGHYGLWEPSSGSLRQQHYWTLPLEGCRHGAAEVRGELRDVLTDAVKKRLVADVEVGSFLSGGVDSSLVSKLATGLSETPLQTFSIGFAEAHSYDERRFARIVAEELGSRHHEECLDKLDVDRLERLIVDHVGQPFADPSLLPTALVSEIAARHVKVALSGDGADELFSGYQRYQARAVFRWYQRLPLPLRSTVEALVTAMPEPTTHHSRSLLKKAHLFVSAARRERSMPPYVAGLMYSPADFDAMFPDLAGRGHPPRELDVPRNLDDVQEMMAKDVLTYLPQDILTKVDRASMAHSLEVRAPFLDSRVVALAFSLPRRVHRRGFSGKRLLRETFRADLPSAIWRRRKQGFSVPVGDWFAGPLGERFLDLLSALDHPLETTVVRAMLEQHRRRQRDYGLHLWAVYVYLLWRAQAVNGMRDRVLQCA